MLTIGFFVVPATVILCSLSVHLTLLYSSYQQQTEACKDEYCMERN